MKKIKPLPAKAIYIHIPFCEAKCNYCDFTSYPDMKSLHDKYVVALIQEIRTTKPQAAISSIYLGGGTPTVLSAKKLAMILDAIRLRFTVTQDAEITLEANPGTVGIAKLRALRKAGFNRLSLGIQSFDNRMLKKLGRIHDWQEALNAYDAARKAEFDNIGIDLMFALPNQSLHDWEKALNKATDLHPEHISLYELTIEDGTPFGDLYEKGRLSLPDEDVQLEMYEMAIEQLQAAGYEHYEISNFAKPGFRSRHNQTYWRNESYFGFGAGATRYIDGHRCSMTNSVKRYIECINEGIDPAEKCETLAGLALMGETIMLAFRTRDGLDIAAFEKRFGQSPLEIFGAEIKSLQASRLLQIDGNMIKPTYKGILLANRVAMEFV